MFKLLYYLIIASVVCNAQSINDINNKISNNKMKISDVSSKKRNINKHVSSLGKKILDKEKSYNDIMKILENTSTKLLLNKMKLQNATNTIERLKESSGKFKSKKEKIEKNVIEFVIEKYSMSMGIEQSNKSSLEDIIGKEVYVLVFDNVKQEILDLNIAYLKINNSIRKNEKKIKKLSTFISKQKSIEAKYKNLELSQEKSLGQLKKQHKSYQKNLANLVNKQNKLTDLLGNLNILKRKEIKREERRITKAKALAKKRAKNKARIAMLAKSKVQRQKDLKFKKRNKLDNDINIEVKKIGSSAKGIKISKYSGIKTIAPLKSYTVSKEFGKYYDKVYKMELFNESVSLKTKKPNAKVFSVFKGQIVYAKQNSGLLENVVIVKHRNNLHTIYSHLDKISPTLKVGKWIAKGYVVGRVNDTLQFQATKDSKYINPLRLIKKKGK